MTRQFSCVFLFLVLCTMFSTAHAFDIAIYNDPLSKWNEWILWCSRHDTTRTPADCAEDVINDWYREGQMDSAYYWYQEMGVTHVMVNYIQPNNFDWITGDSTHIQLMNWNYPGLPGMRGDKYVDAQYRG